MLVIFYIAGVKSKDFSYVVFISINRKPALLGVLASLQSACEGRLVLNLFENRTTLFTGYYSKPLSSAANVFLLISPGFGEISTQANDSYILTFVLCKIHMSISSFFSISFIYCG